MLPVNQQKEVPMQSRELTKSELRRIRRLVKTMCANYDKEYGCLPLDGECYMFCIAFNTSGLCKYFENAVLPLNTELGQVFEGGIKPASKPCKICGKAFEVCGNKAYCSDVCAANGRNKYPPANGRCP